MSEQNEGTQYDRIAQEYGDSKKSDVVTFVEIPTFLDVSGDVRDKAVLDLACGDGFYSRKFGQMGAAPVVGVDISAEMIELARAQERKESLGIRYECADVAKLPSLGEFDIVTAAFLLHYSKDEDEMQAMCDGIAGQLRQGGRFVAMSENPWQKAGRYTLYKKYGFVKTLAEPQIDGAKITYLMATGRRPFKFNVQYFQAQTYERALRNAGFDDIQWHPLVLSEEGRSAKGESHWQEYMDNPPVIGLSAKLA